MLVCGFFNFFKKSNLLIFFFYLFIHSFIYLFIYLKKEINSCELGWLRFENKCFKYVQTKVNFRNATQLCKDQNSTLASIHSKEEHLFIEELARHYSSASGVHWVWLGGKRVKQNITLKLEDNSIDNNETFTNKSLEFVWQDGSEFNYSEWRSNCPDKRTDEDCILM